MKKITPVVVAMAFLLSLSLLVLAQRPASQLDEVSNAIARRIQEINPGWKRNQVTAPSPASSVANASISDRKVLIQQWILNSNVVKVAILRHQSPEEAEAVLRKFAFDVKTSTALAGMGEEGYSWGISGSVAFRKGNMTIYVTVSARDLEQEPSLSKDFAEQITAAIAAY
jgi:hypothetical protein